MLCFDSKAYKYISLHSHFWKTKTLLKKNCTITYFRSSQWRPAGQKYGPPTFHVWPMVSFKIHWNIQRNSAYLALDSLLTYFNHNSDHFSRDYEIITRLLVMDRAMGLDQDTNCGLDVAYPCGNIRSIAQFLSFFFSDHCKWNGNVLNLFFKNYISSWYV